MKEKKKTVTEAAAIISQDADDWVTNGGKGSLYTRIIRMAKKQSKDPVFNIAAWMMYNYGGLYTGEGEKDWLQSARDILKIAGVK